jgi:hypothetical protein
MKSAIRRVENELWQTGVRFHCPKMPELARYRAARTQDPDFAALIDAHTRLAGLYRQKGEVESTMADLFKQEQAITVKMNRLHGEYGKIRDEEGLE